MTTKKVSGREGNKRITADVVVVGGGPGGSAAAKNCAQRGMRTLLLERHTLPRRKTCSGMIISSMAQAIITREFGVIPDAVLTEPPNILGFQWHSSSGDERLDMSPPIINVFRHDFDYWLNQKAKEAGAEIWEGTLVTDVIQDSDGITVQVRRFQEKQEIRARFVVGADGTASITRTRLYPGLLIHYDGTYRECHSGALNVDRRYHHFFGSAPRKPTTDWFSVTHKKGCFIIQCIGTVRPAKELMSRAKQTLADRWGFDLSSKPLWSDGTINRMLRDALLSGKLIPAKGNVLLVGDAAGIFTPSERPNAGEGINMALKTGLLAGNAIIKAADTSQEAAAIYLTEVRPVIEVCQTLLAGISSYTINWTQRNKLLDTLI